MSSPAPVLEPISAPERVQVIDVLRGMALFGILAANMRGFNSPAQVYFATERMWPGTADRIAQGFIDLLISGKFVTLFSFLFGLGFAVQMGRAEIRGAEFAPVYCRRLFVLLLIGLAHGFFLWWGDILSPYALIGFLLLLFRRRSQKTVVTWTMIGLWFPTFLGVVFLTLSALGVRTPAPPTPSKDVIDQAVRVYSQGSFAQIMVRRAKDLQFAYSGAPFYFTVILGMFLLGFYVWRRGLFQNIPDHLPLIRRALWWGLGLGLAGNAAAVSVTQIWHPDPMKPSALGLVRGIVSTIGVPALSCFYASAVILLFQNPAWQKRLAPFGAVGRTALSNYLLQSLICTAIFYSFGLGLFGKVGPAVGLIPTVVIYAAQVPLSVWWLQHFQFGPMEWLWRSLTYRRAQPMRPEPMITVGA